MPDKVPMFPIVAAITGLPKSGKNHFAYTFPDPIKVYCFNGGAEFVARKKFPNKDITITNVTLPILESTSPEPWVEPVFDAMSDEYKKDLETGRYKTYILDTSTELEEVVRQYILETLQEEASAKGKTKQKLATSEYLARNLRMNAIFNRARNAKVNLVTLQYMKEEWVKQPGKEMADRTGRMIMDGWSKTEGAVDIALELEEQDAGGRSVTVARVVRNRFDRELNRKVLKDTDYTEIMALLGLA